uniref:Ycf36 n=1 Tax=Herposiphonia versicolor TaxID=2007163 RepID=A0A1Z1MFF7_9FLOR|nr:hypothetical protein [Herposiphonia versicolor]ARW64790.1 hypothetical protein [Herposiphonia versicolor]
MFSSKSNCPVPFDQQPLNEYLALKDSFLFSWSVSSKKSFIFGLLVVFIFLIVVFGILLVLSVNVNNFPKFLLLDVFFSNLVVSFLFIRLYLGWSYVFKRLLSATIFYEESGWYDGQVWVKTSNYLIQDRLIGKYQVMPFINRIRYTFLILCINCFVMYLLVFVF